MVHDMHNVNIQVKHDYSSSDFESARPMLHNRRMNIVQIRTARSLTQEDLADISGLSQPTVSRAEKGSSGTTLRQFRAISVALNVPLADLFQEDRARRENELLDMFRQLSPERQAIWLQMAQTLANSPALPT